MKKAAGLILMGILLATGWARSEEPERVVVQHILIAFKGSLPSETVTRTKDEAEKLAVEIFEKAKAGEDFDALVKEYTDDSHPGIYGITNFGIEPRTGSEPREYSRSRMVKSFGDVSFSLEVNGVGIAVYHSDNSKFGWHIIKRLK